MLVKLLTHHTPITSLHDFQSTLFLLVLFYVAFLLTPTRIWVQVIQVTRFNLSGYASEKKEWAFQTIMGKNAMKIIALNVNLGYSDALFEAKTSLSTSLLK